MRNHSHLGRSLLTTAVLVCAVFIGFGADASARQPGARSAPHSTGADIVRDPADVPAPVGNRQADTVRVDLQTKEVVGVLDPETGATYRYWTFNGKVPGPMIRVRQGDTVEVVLHNDASSHMVHSIDLHAAIGPGGGATMSQVMPGQTKSFTFEATTPGLFVYHCGTPMIADHIANGMYGLILVEPPGGLPPVDHEYYVMQGEVYTQSAIGASGLQAFSETKLLAEAPEYFVMNGAVDALSRSHALEAKVGQTVRIFFGNAGPNKTSSMHAVGEIFSHDYQFGSLTSPPLNGVQTAGVPPGDAAILELTMHTPGQVNFMDHAIGRMAKGLMGTINVSGTQTAILMYPGFASDKRGGPGAKPIEAITAADIAADVSDAGSSGPIPDSMDAATRTNMSARGDLTRDRRSKLTGTSNPSAVSVPVLATRTKRDAFGRPISTLNGCLTLQPDGKVMLQLLNSRKLYRLEGRPLVFDANDHRVVHVSGYFGSVVAWEDPSTPSFVVDQLDMIAHDCSARVTAADIRKVEAKYDVHAVAGGATVGMEGMSFTQPTVTIYVGQQVTWKNTSSTIHNVVADPTQALIPADVRLPAGAGAFSSAFLQPGQWYSHTFTVPGVYKYVCTLHEGNGMKGTVVVKAPDTTMAAAQR